MLTKYFSNLFSPHKTSFLAQIIQKYGNFSMTEIQFLIAFLQNRYCVGRRTNFIHENIVGGHVQFNVSFLIFSTEFNWTNFVMKLENDTNNFNVNSSNWETFSKTIVFDVSSIEVTLWVMLRNWSRLVFWRGFQCF